MMIYIFGAYVIAAAILFMLLVNSIIKLRKNVKAQERKSIREQV